ncbi:MAG: glycosyltransferase [Bacteroidota bacterium]
MYSLWGISIDTEWVIFGLFIFLAIIQFFYLAYFFARFAFYKKKQADKQLVEHPVSVVICAKNEYHNLEKNLPLILDQNYSNYEVVVVNDCSNDDSDLLLKSFEKKYSKLKIVHLRENVNFFSGKKLALSVGIKSASNEIVLLTDADCKPSGKDWITNMQKHFDNGTEIVLGYSGYNKEPGFLNMLIRFDTVSIAMQYFGYALAGLPYMGVGRNMAYKKSLFYKAKGFTSHYRVKSGDDDIFINQTATNKNTKIEIAKSSHTYSNPKKSFTKWFLQKKRHMTSGKYYKKRHKFLLGLFSVSQFLFFVSFIALAIILEAHLFVLIAGATVILRWAFLLLLYYSACRKLNELKLFLYSPIFEIIFLLLNPIFIISNLIFKGNKWK